MLRAEFGPRRREAGLIGKGIQVLTFPSRHSFSLALLWQGASLGARRVVGDTCGDRFKYGVLEPAGIDNDLVTVAEEIYSPGFTL
jgi:hypothetical protein